MRHTISLFLILLSASLLAAPKLLKPATKSQATLYAVQQRGDTLQANAFFVEPIGTLVAPFKPIQQARQAWVVDASGKRHEVGHIQGFNSTYDVVRLQVVGIKKMPTLPTSSDAVSNGQAVYTMPQGKADQVTQVEKAGEYAYYTLQSPASPDMAGTAVVDEEGRIVGVLQVPVTVANAPNYVLDIRFVQALTIRPMDANHVDLRQCAIPKQLPADQDQATSFLYLSGSLPANERQVYADDFVLAFPHSPVGYVQKADALVSLRDYAGAWQTYEQALADKQLTQPDEVYYARSRAIYNKAIQGDTLAVEGWTLEQAQSDIEKALQINALPLYSRHLGQIFYAQKQYEQAYSTFMALTKTPMRSAELFLYAWQCKQHLGADNETLLALNDSAMAFFTKPYSAEAAPYLYLRSNTLRDMGRLRDAIADLNEYEHVLEGKGLNANFYYQREQMETSVRMFGPAINDIQKAIQLAPSEPLFRAESASLFIRLRDLDNAILECKRAVELDGNFPDAYRLWGICLREKGDKAGAREQLQRAKDLGDTVAAKILDEL